MFEPYFQTIGVGYMNQYISPNACLHKFFFSIHFDFLPSQFVSLGHTYLFGKMCHVIWKPYGSDILQPTTFCEEVGKGHTPLNNSHHIARNSRYFSVITVFHDTMTVFGNASATVTFFHALYSLLQLCCSLIYITWTLYFSSNTCVGSLTFGLFFNTSFWAKIMEYCHK